MNWLIAIVPLQLLVLILLRIFFLIPITVETALLLGILAAELLSGMLTAFARRRSDSQRYLAHSITRVSKSQDRRSISGRLEWSLNVIRDFLKERLGPEGYEAYILEPFSSAKTSDEDEAPTATTSEDDEEDDEVPSTFSELSRAISMEYVDRVHTDEWPWPSLDPLASKMMAAIESSTQEASLREALAESFVEVRPWYRRWSISPRPSRLNRFVVLHMELLSLLAAIMILIFTAVGILVQLWT